MSLELAAILRAMHRSRVRVGILLELETRQIAYLGQLERALGTRAESLRSALHGRPPAYSVEGAPITLGLVREVRTRRGVAYAITPLGERVARFARAEARESQRSRRRLFTELARVRGL